MKSKEKKSDENKKPEELMDKFAEAVVKYSITTPAILFLEVAKPFSLIGTALFIQFTAAFKWVFGSKYDEIIPIMEKRDNIEKIIQKIEELEKYK